MRNIGRVNIDGAPVLTIEAAEELEIDLAALFLREAADHIQRKVRHCFCGSKAYEFSGYKCLDCGEVAPVLLNIKRNSRA
jgi:hypothetical protein